MENFNNDPFACIDHVGFAVKDMDEAIKYHSRSDRLKRPERCCAGLSALCGVVSP